MMDIQPPDTAETWLTFIDEQLRLHAAKRDRVHLYALIDGRHDEKLLARLQKGRHDTVSLWQARGIADKELLAISPLLWRLPLALNEASSLLLRKLMDSPMLSLIVTPEPRDELAARLASWSVVDAARQHLQLHFADTRILPTLWQTLVPDQLAALHGPALAWHYPDRFYRWRDLPLAGLKLPALDKVTLSEKQCAALISAAEPDETIAIWRQSSSALPDWPAGALHAALSQWLADADKQKIDASRERIAYCEQRLAETKDKTP